MFFQNLFAWSLHFPLYYDNIDGFLCHHKILCFFRGKTIDFVKIMFDKQANTLYNV